LADEETLANYHAFALGIVTMIIGTWNFYDLVQMTRCRRVDAPYRWQVATNRFMISRFPDDLTPQGRRYRHRWLLSSKLFIGCWIVWVAIIFKIF
jgi:hypothetical protein